jgi:hypothetical protein
MTPTKASGPGASDARGARYVDQLGRRIDVKATHQRVHLQASHDGARNSGRQRLVQHLHAAGPRPIFEAMIELADGRDLDSVLERYARIPVGVYHALGADRLPIEALTLLDGGVA